MNCQTGNFLNILMQKQWDIDLFAGFFVMVFLRNIELFKLRSLYGKKFREITKWKKTTSNLERQISK